MQRDEVVFSVDRCLRKAVAAGTNAEKVALLKAIGVVRKDGTLARQIWNRGDGPTRTPELEG